ncbi:MAG: glycoside hydrolase family 3 N-terminal domain-containing protein, partial [Thermodesulfobacteriota bacterium]
NNLGPQIDPRLTSKVIEFNDIAALETALSARDVAAVLAAMSLEEKVGQLFTVYFEGPLVSDDLRGMIANYHIGGVIYYGVSGNVENPAQVAALSRDIQAEAAKTPRGVGLFVSVDQEGGPVARLRREVTLFPSNMAVAATGKPKNARIAAEITARELRTLGINVNFAPVADVNVNPDNPIIGIRSYGQDPARVSRFVAAAVRGYDKNRMLCTPKHFPGHGDTATDSHLGLPMVTHDAATFARVDLPPFQAAISAGTRAIMTAHVELPAVDPTNTPSTLSRPVLIELLRNRLGFRGLVFTDSLGMGALAGTVGTVEAAARALAAGADVLLFGADRGHTPAQQRQAYARVLAGVRSGEIPESRLDESVRRILETKRNLGIMEAKAIPSPADPAIPGKHVGTAAHRQSAERIARESMTILRDTRHMLPLENKGRTLVIRPAKGVPDVDEQACEALAAWPGTEVLAVSPDPGPDEIAAAMAGANRAEAVVMLVSDASRRPGQASLARSLLTAAPGKTVLVASGAPYDAALFPEAPCVAATYGDVPVSLAALGQALFGKIPFRGRCPVDILKNESASN